MLLKQFLNNNDHQYLLDFAKSLTYDNKSPGNNAKYICLEKIQNKYLDEIISKIDFKLLLNDNDFKFFRDESLFLRINNFGCVSVHTDWDGKCDKIRNFNLLLKKPKEGGFILHGNKKVIQEEKDVYILDGHIVHGISSIISDDEYYSLVLVFYK